MLSLIPFASHKSASASAMSVAQPVLAVSFIDKCITGVNHAFNALVGSLEAAERAQQEAYLSQSTTMADLESRMRDLDRQEGTPRLNMMTGMH
ncbi:hypothetical protein RCH09_002593 [Actimicrobium sp. GrIS 1.19]|uniref:DUF3563 family protein n=1 Tax=Actimicrobium sp. GrIS 1.19 TaxID=3071708 RepID=UPI002DFD7BF4|nr:hypothetical protein [Actimicrobium sp. GrIS 1.19]